MDIYIQHRSFANSPLAKTESRYNARQRRHLTDKRLQRHVDLQQRSGITGQGWRLPSGKEASKDQKTKGPTVKPDITQRLQSTVSMPELQRTTDGGALKQTIRNFHDSYESKVVKRDRSVASTNETLQGIGANQTSDQHLQKPASPSDTESSGDTKINQDFKRQDNPLRATGCITEDNNWHPTESATYDRTIRHYGTSHGCQGSREDDCVGQSDQQSLRNNVHENPMGGVHNAKNGLSWHTGILHHKKV